MTIQAFPYGSTVMQLTDILHADCVKVPLESASKQDAVFELADVLCRVHGIDDEQGLKDAIWQREMTRTTGIGHGIAIPHGKVADCNELVMAVGRCGTPLDFGAIDSQPVELIFLLASPIDQTGPHIQALATISRMLMDLEFRSALKQAATASDLFELIAQREATQPTG